MHINDVMSHTRHYNEPDFSCFFFFFFQSRYSTQHWARADAGPSPKQVASHFKALRRSCSSSRNRTVAGRHNPHCRCLRLLLPLRRYIHYTTLSLSIVSPVVDLPYTARVLYYTLSPDTIYTSGERELSIHSGTNFTERWKLAQSMFLFKIKLIVKDCFTPFPWWYEMRFFTDRSRQMLPGIFE